MRVGGVARCVGVGQEKTGAAVLCAARGARRHLFGWAELGREALGVAREHRRLADVVQAEEEHDLLRVRVRVRVRARVRGG